MLETFIKQRTVHPFKPGIKVNVYRDYEYRALAQAIHERHIDSVESVMVGDSYFMTHLGRASTRLSLEDSRLAITELPRLVAAIRREIDKDEHGIRKPLLMADIPDGLDRAQMEDVVLRFRDAGADMIKLEVVDEGDLWVIPRVHAAGMMSGVHLGYNPQKNENRTYGRSVAEIRAYMDLLDEARAAGSSFVIFERLTELGNMLLTRHAIQRGLLPYSIFSGRAPLGGQSLNLWDSVVKPDRKSIFFPPTAYLGRAEVPERYTAEAIRLCIGKLLVLTMANVFPSSPRNQMEVEDYITILEQCA